MASVGLDSPLIRTILAPKKIASTGHKKTDVEPQTYGMSLSSRKLSDSGLPIESPGIVTRERNNSIKKSTFGSDSKKPPPLKLNSQHSIKILNMEFDDEEDLE